MSADVFTIARDEIEAILKKHDMAGVIIMVKPQRANYSIRVDPSWSCITSGLAADGRQTIRARTTDKPVDQRKQLLEQTTGMLVGMVDTLEVIKGELAKVIRLVSTHFQISHVTKHQRPPNENESQN